MMVTEHHNKVKLKLKRKHTTAHQQPNCYTTLPQTSNCSDTKRYQSKGLGPPLLLTHLSILYHSVVQSSFLAETQL